MSPDRHRPIRVLFNTWANRENVNSQSLTAREIACRLDPERFRPSLFLGARQEPDPRLAERANVNLIRVPPRLGSLAIAGQLLWGGHDVVVYPSLNERASRLASRLWPLARRRAVVHCVETSLDQAAAAPPAAVALARRWAARADLVTAITPAIARDLAARWGIAAEVVPLGVDLERFQPADRAGHTPPWRVLYVASDPAAEADPPGDRAGAAAGRRAGGVPPRRPGARRPRLPAGPARRGRARRLYRRPLPRAAGAAGDRRVDGALGRLRPAVAAGGIRQDDAGGGRHRAAGDRLRRLRDDGGGRRRDRLSGSDPRRDGGGAPPPARRPGAARANGRGGPRAGRGLRLGRRRPDAGRPC